MTGRAAGRPTLADVAELSGMSKTAVSLVLNDKPGSRLSAAAAEKIRNAAEELGYRPDPAARGLRLGTTRTIGFISDEVTITRFASGMIRGVLGAARQHDHAVLIAETGGDGVERRSAVEAMTDRRTDGLLFGLMASRSIDLSDVPSKLPRVIVNGTSTNDDPSILPDERAAGADMVRVLLDAGHRRIAVIGDAPTQLYSPSVSVTIPARFHGVDSAFEAAGVRPVVRIPLEHWLPEFGYEATGRALDDHPEVTALLCANDRIAFGAYQAIAERGLVVPTDISVASFDDEEVASFQRPGLTTARLPYEEMARRGVEMLLGTREAAHELVPMPVIRRGSVRVLGG